VGRFHLYVDDAQSEIAMHFSTYTNLIPMIIISLTAKVHASIRCYSCMWNDHDSVSSGCADLSEEVASAQDCERCEKSELWVDGYLQSVYRSCALTLPEDDHWKRKQNCIKEQVYFRGRKQTQINCVCSKDFCNSGNILQHKCAHLILLWILIWIARYLVIPLDFVGGVR